METSYTHDESFRSRSAQLRREAEHELETGAAKKRGQTKSEDAFCLDCGFEAAGGANVGLCPKCASGQWYRTTLEITASESVHGVEPIHPPLMDEESVIEELRGAACVLAKERDDARAQLQKFARTVWFQANGDLSAEDFRNYIKRIAGEIL